MLAQEILRPVHGQLNRHFCSSGQIENLKKLMVLVAADGSEAFDLPGHYSRKERPRRLNRRRPLLHAYRLPRMLPAKWRGWHRAPRRPDIAPKCKKLVEPAEKLHIPRHPLGDSQLRECRITVDERREGDARILLAPEPG